jgi:tripartite-type tricarboxylate transporter receptor subunit TctC
MRLAAGIAAAAIALAAQCAVAQNYPEKSIRLIIPYAPGGTTDILGRAIAQKLSEAFGQSVVPDNRAGAGGNVGSEIAAKSPPDGYTLLLAPVSPMAINVSLYGEKLKFNPEKDFTPLTLIAKVPLLLVVHPSVPAKNVRQFIALAKSRPGKLTYGSSGNGSSNHLTGEMFKSAAGIDVLHIPYKGGGPAAVALMSGELDMAVLQVPSAAVLVRAGRLRALAVSGAKRSVALPDVPTIAESGLPGFEATSWYCIVAPAGVPNPIITRLHSALMKILNSPGIRDRLIAEGANVETTTPEELMAFVRAEIPKWAKAVKDSGAKLD